MMETMVGLPRSRRREFVRSSRLATARIGGDDERLGRAPTPMTSLVFGNLDAFRQGLDIRADYDAAKQSKFRSVISGYLPMGSNADWHIRVESDFWRIMEWARYFRRNSPIVSPAISRVARHVVRRAYQLIMDTGDKDFNKLVQDDFRFWSSSPEACDVRGRQNLTEMFAQSVDSVLTDGELYLTPVIGQDKALRLQFLEAHRCRGERMPSGVHGIELGAYGRPSRFTMTDGDYGFFPQVSQTNLVPVNAYGAFGRADEPLIAQLYLPNRFSQNRGISCFAPCFDLIGMHDDLQFNVLVRSQLQNCVTLIRNRSATVTPPPRISEDGTQNTETLADGSSRTRIDKQPGSELASHPGETISAFQTTTPNETFFPHVELILTFVAMNCHLPLQALLFDPKKNFSAWRGAQEEAKAGFIGLQQWLIDHEARQIVRWFLLAKQLTDPRYVAAEEKLGPRFFQHEWQAPGWDYIEPSKDATADNLQAKTGLSSRTRLASKRGHKFSDENLQGTKDIGLAIRNAITEAKEINAEFPKIDPPVSWLMTCAIELQGIKQPTPVLEASEAVLAKNAALVDDETDDESDDDEDDE